MDWVELIGEEIYDEFDVEGTGLHSHSFVPPGAHPGQENQKLRKKNSAPELAATASEKVESAASSTTIGGIVAAPTPIASKPFSLAMPMPTALHNLKNLGFLRSRSAPPVPRDGVGKNAAKSETGGHGEAEATPPLPSSEHLSIGTPDVVGQTTGYLPVGQSGSSSNSGAYFTAPGIVAVNPDGEVMPLGQIDEPSAVGSLGDHGANTKDSSIVAPQPHSRPPSIKFSAPSTPTPRSSSPAPLEAILYERKKRSGHGQLSGGATSGTGSPLMSPAIGAATSGKTRGGFKSSPLNQSPLDVAGGLVVAEEAKREMQSANEVEGSGMVREKQEKDEKTAGPEDEPRTLNESN